MMRFSRAWLALATLVLALGSAAAVHVKPVDLPAPLPLEADVPIQDTIFPNQTRCYLISLDADTTREIAYWPKGKLFLHLQPCSGTPHLKASVFGCPSHGKVVNWEYQSYVARNDLIAKGLPVTPEWEWIGDIETMSIPLTHRRYYVEVSSYHTPLRTNESIRELGDRFRKLGYDDEADRIEDILFIGQMTILEVAELRKLMRILMPPASYVLSAHLHDADSFPQNDIFPLSNTPQWDREITVEKDATIIAGGDPYAGHYLISFWPPTLAGAQLKEGDNSSSAANATDELSETQRRWLDDLVPIHTRRVKEMRDEGPVTMAHLEQLVKEHPDLPPDFAAELEEARKVFHPSDIIFEAHPGSEHARHEGMRRALEHEEMMSEEQKQLEEWKQSELSKIDAELAKLQGAVDKGRFEQAAEHGRKKYREHVHKRDKREAEFQHMRRGNRLRVVSSTNESTTGVANVLQRLNNTLHDSDLEYMVYWMDITAAVRLRWGVTTNSMLVEKTRLLDSEPKEGPLCGPLNPDTSKCGIKQLITRSEFTRIDKDANGVIDREEYEVEYPEERQKVDDGFVPAYSFEKAAANNSLTDGIEYTTWRNVYDGHQAIFDKSVKDPTARTYWTVCGLNSSGTRMVPSGNVTKSPSRAEWLDIRGFERTPEGKMVRTIKGLDDSDNNIYVINVVVRSRKTGESFAYKPHVLQRKFPDYEAPDAMDSTGTTIVMAVGITAGVIVLSFCLMVAFSKNKKPRPQIKVVR
jgi:hypothetical protein